MFIAEQMAKLKWSYLACGIAKEKKKNQSIFLIEANCYGHVAKRNFHFWMGKLKHVDDFIRTSFSNRSYWAEQLCSCNYRLHWIKRWPAGFESFVPILVPSYLSSWGLRGFVFQAVLRILVPSKEFCNRGCPTGPKNSAHLLVCKCNSSY